MDIRPVQKITPTGLTALPTELILRIGSLITDIRALGYLTRSSKRLHAILNPELYRKGVKSALFCAARDANIETAQLCFAAGAHINVLLRSRRGRHGNTPITVAVVNRTKKERSLVGRPEAMPRRHERYDKFIRFLLARGADLNVIDRQASHSVLQVVAQREGPLSMFRMLLENGADPEVRDIGSRGGVLHDILRGLGRANPDRPTDLLDMLRLSIEYGGDPNGRDNANLETPLHIAADLRWGKNGGCAVVERAALLLQHGADINAKDYNDRPPLATMLRKPIHNGLLKLFLENGADTSLCRLPPDREMQKKIMETCDEVSRSTGGQFEFIPCSN